MADSDVQPKLAQHIKTQSNEDINEANDNDNDNIAGQSEEKDEKSDNAGARSPVNSITARMRTIDPDDDINLNENNKDNKHSAKGPPLATERYKHVGIELDSENGKIYFKEHATEADGKRHIVFVEMKITRVSEIDTSNETFRCTFHMFFTWLASKSEVLSYNEYMESKKEGKKRDNGIKTWKPDWEPRLVFMNSNGTSNVWRLNVPYQILNTDQRSALQSSNWGMDEKYLGFNPNLGSWIHGMWQGDFDLTEEMELESFPFDCQDFTINIRSVIGAEKCDLLPMPRKTSKNGGSGIVPIQFFSKDSVVDEWKFVNLLCEFRLSNPKHSRSQKVYPKIMVQIKAERTWEAYIGLIIVTFALFWMGLGAFSIEVESGGERLGYCITLLLAEVVNIQWAFNTLPNVPYLTIIEKYIYASFIFLFIITSYSCLVCGILYNDIDGLFGWNAGDVDELFGWIFLFSNVICQLWFYVHSKNSMKSERKHLMAQTISYRERRSAVQQTVDLPIAFDENLMHSCAQSGKKDFCGLSLSSRTAQEIIDDLNKLQKM